MTLRLIFTIVLPVHQFFTSANKTIMLRQMLNYLAGEVGDLLGEDDNFVRVEILFGEHDEWASLEISYPIWKQHPVIALETVQGLWDDTVDWFFAQIPLLRESYDRAITDAQKQIRGCHKELHWLTLFEESVKGETDS